MEKLIAVILLFVILLLAVGCTDRQKDPSDTTQATNGTETDLSDQTSATTAQETSSPTPGADVPFVTGDDGVDLPVDPF